MLRFVRFGIMATAVVAVLTAGLGVSLAAGETNSAGGLPALAARVAALEAVMTHLQQNNDTLQNSIAQLQTALTQETARAQAAEAQLREAQRGELWHGYYMQNGNKVGWLAYVTNDGSTFHGWMSEWIGSTELIADISGTWSNGGMRFTKTYRMGAEPIEYTGAIGGNGDITGTWTTSFGSDTWAMSR